MRKILIRVLAFLCVLTLVPIFSACNSEAQQTQGSEASGYHTITFNTNGGSKIGDITVKHDTFAKEPTPPTLENYVFCRWQTSEGRAFFFDMYTVKENINLEAIWIKAEDLFGLSAMPDSNGIMITEIKRQEDFDVLYVPEIINGKTVEGIGAGALKGTIPSHASTIVFPDTVRYVEEDAFASIPEVNIILNGTLTHIEEGSFFGAALITKISLGKGITTIPYRAFSNCAMLKTANLPEGITAIEENAFDGCERLVTLILPSTLIAIEDSAFEECDSLKTVFFGGTEEEFDLISIAAENEAIENATVYYYSEEQPTSEGNFWHYNKNQIPTIW